jgi:hypothetical protein
MDGFLKTGSTSQSADRYYICGLIYDVNLQEPRGSWTGKIN